MTGEDNKEPQELSAPIRSQERLIKDAATPTSHHTDTLDSDGEGGGQEVEQSGGNASSSDGSQGDGENTQSDES